MKAKILNLGDSFGEPAAISAYYSKYVLLNIWPDRDTTMTIYNQPGENTVFLPQLYENVI